MVVIGLFQRVNAYLVSLGKVGQEKLKHTGWTNDSVSAWFLDTAFNNSILNTNDEVKLTAPFNYSTPDFTPQTGSPLLTGAAFADPKLTGNFFTPVTYRGAVGPAGSADADWWKGWSSLNLGL